MPDRNNFSDRFDREAAERMVEATSSMAGIPAMMGLSIVKFEPGRLHCHAALGEELITPSGNIHGGAVAAVLDHITGAVVYPLMPDGWWGATVELKLNYVAPATSGTLYAEATILTMSKRLAVVRGEAYRDERLVCAAQGTIALVAPRPDPAA